MEGTFVGLDGRAVVQVATRRTDAVKPYMTKMDGGVTYFFAFKDGVDIGNLLWDVVEEAPRAWRQPPRTCIVGRSLMFP